ncbi:efflux RND transporter periplasmic adaptor subunit [Alkaliphilus sp. B6464]|uniref:efflux RND transporter periplasmic adaptor subunit n=1 Tax=Alkaliphilus sp. B6464 TaxID=2731219 RepID=UPI001BA5DAFB|nr:efflux RND transporter periplasmic adaptor subunit [Alkaliphilus sp. B6464]QUH19156.1 efflux RND transporter periplasmic adaptor subunit [Alkaliphilus sp. B6464]
MFQRTIMIILVVVIILGGGFYAYQQLVPEVQDVDAGPVYATQEVIRGDISVGVNTIGQLNPSDGGGIRVSDALRMSGYSGEFIIDQILVKEGDSVSKGQTLVRLAATGLNDKISELEDEVKREEQALMRLTDLPREKIRDIDPSQGVTVRAPIAGRIQDLDIVEGDKILQGQTINRIVDISTYSIPLRLTPGEYSRVKKGDKVNIHFANFEGTYEGAITRINPNAAPSGTSEDKQQGYIYRATVEGKNIGLVQPNMSVRVGLPTPQGQTIFFMNDSIVEKYVNQERVASSTEGIVTEVHVQEMDEVEEGDPIISLAGADVQETIQTRLDKIRELESKIRELNAIFPMLEITSTMDGVVASMYRQEGESTTPGDWLGHVYTTSSMSMFTEIDDIDVLYVTQGSQVKVTVDAIPGETYEGEVQEVSTRGTGQDGLSKFSVYIDVKGGPQLRPGMQAKGYIDAGTAEDVLIIPIEAIFQEENRHKVEILGANGEAQVVNVELGLMNDRHAEVISGLEEGDLVITGSSRDLLPSQENKTNNNNLIPDKPTEEETAED